MTAPKLVEPVVGCYDAPIRYTVDTDPEEGGIYGAVAAPGVIQIIPLAIIVAGLRAVELRIQRRAQAQQS